MTLHLGIALALLCAVTTNVGFLLKHRGASVAPDVRWSHPVATAVALFRSKWFAIGWLVALGAWLLHIGALALAPLSVVQAVISGGLVLLTVLAERVFGYSVGRRQWLGVGFTALGLVLLAVTLPGGHGTYSTYSLAGIIAFESGLLAVGILLVLSPRLGTPRHHHGVLLGLAAGLLFGVGAISIKALTGLVGDGGLLAVISPWLAAGLLAWVLSFYAAAHGFQRGDAVAAASSSSAIRFRATRSESSCSASPLPW